MPKVTAGNHRAQAHRPWDHSSPVKGRGTPLQRMETSKSASELMRVERAGMLPWYANLEPEAEREARVCQGPLSGSTPTPRDLHEDLAFPTVNQPTRAHSRGPHTWAPMV